MQTNIATMSIEMNLPNLHKVDKMFTEYFGETFKNYYDHSLSVMMRRVQLDMYKFDDFLKSKGMNENIENMNDFVLRTYGDDARCFILRLI